MKSYFNNKIYLAEYTPNIIISILALAMFQLFLWLVATILDSADLEHFHHHRKLNWIELAQNVSIFDINL